ncbi:MAG: metal ABC transporter ATP-binding protein [Oligoflexales bacterium]|nr:metal ABC transporter ATP-binding protein [Oligoflexales bacterium]
MQAPVLEFKDVNFSYNGEELILENASFRIKSGEFIGILGPNGGGKTTAMRLALGLIKPSSGSVFVFGEAPEKSRLRIGYVPQFINFTKSFPITVLEMVCMGRIENGLGKNYYSKNDRAASLALIEKLALQQYADSPIARLSGGQMQRALVARALVCKPGLLLLDEPTASIDQSGELSIYEWLNSMKGETTIVTISHDIAFVSKYVDRVICINRRVSEHQTKELSGDSLAAIYGTDFQMVHHHHQEI